MLAQTMFAVLFLATLSFAFLANSVVSAKIIAQHRVARYTDAAIDDGVANFTGSLQEYVKTYGPAGPWPTAVATSFPRSVCDPSVPVAECPYGYVISARITGDSTSGGGFLATTPPANDTALNLEKNVIDEERVSAVVTATVTTQTGTVVGTRTRYLTMRVFGAPPYAIVSGERDLATVNGSAIASEGDNGGTSANSNLRDAASPDPGSPEKYRDTTIKVKLMCKTIDNIQPVGKWYSSNQAPGNDNLPWGLAAQHAYELPCVDSIETPPPLNSYQNELWRNGNDNLSGIEQ